MITKMANGHVLVVLILCLVQWPEILAVTCSFPVDTAPIYFYCGENHECCAEPSESCCEKKDNSIYGIAIGCVLGGAFVTAIVAGIIFYYILKKKNRANVEPGTERNFGRQIHVPGPPLPRQYHTMTNYQPRSHGNLPIPPPVDGGNM